MPVFESIETGGINPFAKRGLELLANGVSTAVLEDALQRELDAYERNHMAAARIWQQAGGYARTFGILGAVLGLIQVTGHMPEPAQLGHGSTSHSSDICCALLSIASTSLRDLTHGAFSLASPQTPSAVFGATLSTATALPRNRQRDTH
ncbi:hypothetical protein OKW46_001106 [Paraburkholderia sp. WSM4179]|nr:hypothetical protein [Paraburkholderia sp. WSM4179]